MEDDAKPPSTVPTKKQKIVDLNELAGQAWVHYRNYLDSCPDDENNDDGCCEGGGAGGDGDIDELQELLDDNGIFSTPANAPITVMGRVVDAAQMSYALKQ